MPARSSVVDFALFGAVCVGATVYHHAFSKRKPIAVEEAAKYDRTPLVVVTGCDTGFGRLLSNELARKGGTIVVSLCLADESVEELKKLGIHGVKCDVTSDEDVRRAGAFVESLLKEKGAVLSALVNNAGVALPGDFVFYRGVHDIRKVMDVNFLGQLRVAQALLPLFLRTSPVYGGRILNVSSVCGASACPGNSSYNASKFAVEAWSDSLRVELAPFNIKVVKIRPGQFSTSIQESWQDGFMRQYLDSTSQVKELYGGDSYVEKVEKVFGENAGGHADPAEAVDEIAKLLEMDLNDLSPYYWLGRDAATFWNAMSRLPTGVSDSVKLFMSLAPVKTELPPPGVISHVTIRVRSLARSIPFYEAFGLAKHGEAKDGQQFLSSGSSTKWSTLVLLREDPTMEYRGECHEAGMTRLNVYTKNHDWDVKRLEGLGIEPIGPTCYEAGVKLTAFRDPDGFVVYLDEFKGVLGLIVRFMLWKRKQRDPYLFHWTINVMTNIQKVMRGFETLGFKTLSDQDSTQVLNDLLPAFNIDPDTTKFEHIRLCHLPDDVFCTALMQWNHPRTEKRGWELTNAMCISVDDVDHALGLAREAGFTTKGPEQRELPTFGRVSVGTVYVEPGSAPVEVCCFSEKY